VNGSQNVGVGAFSMYAYDLGTGNVAVGYETFASLQGGNLNTCIGAYANVIAGTYDHATAIGADAVCDHDDRVWVGSSTDEVWTDIIFQVSDRQFKENIKDDVIGLEFIKLLRPVVYNFNTRKQTEHFIKDMPDSLKKHYLNKDFSHSSSIRQTGFIAQEVEEAAKKANYNFSGVHVPDTDNDTYGLSYIQFVVPLVKAVQEQQILIEADSIIINSLKDQVNSQNQKIDSQQKQIDELKAMMQAVLGVTQDSKNTNIQSVEVTDKNVIVLNQNVPNPFAESTTISYNIPTDFNKAQIIFTTMDGTVIKSVELTSKGKGVLNIFASDLTSGMYNYSLIVDGRTIETKKLIKN
jgi:hypothetical protein